MLLMIENYVSFTYNLVRYFEELNVSVSVYYNDQITLDDIKKINPNHIVISPGPGRPEESGITLSAIRSFAGKIPILGVCLGHQAIAQVFGAKIVLAEKVMHGKTSMIYHNQRGIFNGIDNPFVATRYHSLVVDKTSLSPEFEITAWTDQHEIMAIRHKNYLLEGVQFHPESILTNFGHKLLLNFLNPSSQFSCQANEVSNGTLSSSFH